MRICSQTKKKPHLLLLEVGNKIEEFRKSITSRLRNMILPPTPPPPPSLPHFLFPRLNSNHKMAARHADAPALNTPGQALHATATEPPTPFGGVHFEHKLGQVIVSGPVLSWSQAERRSHADRCWAWMQKRDGDETLWMVVSVGWLDQAGALAGWG